MDYSFKMEYKELLECCKGIATHSEQFHGNVCPSSVPRQIESLYVEPSVLEDKDLSHLTLDQCLEHRYSSVSSALPPQS